MVGFCIRVIWLKVVEITGMENPRKAPKTLYKPRKIIEKHGNSWKITKMGGKRWVFMPT